MVAKVPTQSIVPPSTKSRRTLRFDSMAPLTERERRELEERNAVYNLWGPRYDSMMRLHNTVRDNLIRPHLSGTSDLFPIIDVGGGTETLIRFILEQRNGVRKRLIEYMSAKPHEPAIICVDSSGEMLGEARMNIRAGLGVALGTDTNLNPDELIGEDPAKHRIVLIRCAIEELLAQHTWLNGFAATGFASYLVHWIGGKGDDSFEAKRRFFEILYALGKDGGRFIHTEEGMGEGEDLNTHTAEACSPPEDKDFGRRLAEAIKLHTSVIKMDAFLEFSKEAGLTPEFDFSAVPIDDVEGHKMRIIVNHV